MADYLIKEDSSGGFSVEAISERAQKRGGVSTKNLTLIFRDLVKALRFVKSAKAEGFTFEEMGLRLLKLEHLRRYFQKERPEFEVTKRYAFDQRATRYDFIHGADHFMFDIPDDLVADCEVPEIVIKLVDSNWWTVLQSCPAPSVVTFSSQGYTFSEAA